MFRYKKLISADYFLELQNHYFNFIEDTKIDLGISENMTYGIHSKADMSGGAEQIVTPFSGQDMLDLGIMIQRR